MTISSYPSEQTYPIETKCLFKHPGSFFLTCLSQLFDQKQYWISLNLLAPLNKFPSKLDRVSDKNAFDGCCKLNPCSFVMLCVMAALVYSHF